MRFAALSGRDDGPGQVTRAAPTGLPQMPRSVTAFWLLDASMIVPPPTYSATWLPPPAPQKMRSPGWTASSGTCGRLAYIEPDDPDSETPAAPQDAMTSPEQS